MKTLASTAAIITGLTLLTGCERQYAKQDFALENLGPPSVDVTGTWTASWQDPKRGATEAFTMDLRQKGTNLAGAAAFMDANGTKADVTGQMSGTKLRLLMSPHPTAPYHATPETTWLGTITNGTIAGTWYFHGRVDRGYASTGPWSASPKPATGAISQDGAANGNQPIRSETNRTSSAAGSRR